MNFYFEACKVLDKLDGKQGSIKGIIASLPEKDRKRTAALVIETLKCETAFNTVPYCSYSRSITVKAVLRQIIETSELLKTERKKITSLNLALVLVHDLLLARGIQAGDGPVKQAILRHKARLHGEFQKAKIKKGVSSNAGLANDGDERAGHFILVIRLCFLSNSRTDHSIDTALCPGKHTQDVDWRCCFCIAGPRLHRRGSPQFKVRSPFCSTSFV